MFTSHLLLDYINECSSEGSSFLLYDGTHALYIDYDDLTGSSIYIGPLFNDSPFLSQSTQEKVMHFFRKPRILAIGSNYETKSKYVMGGSK